MTRSYNSNGKGMLRLNDPLFGGRWEKFLHTYVLIAKSLANHNLRLTTLNNFAHFQRK